MQVVSKVYSEVQVVQPPVLGGGEEHDVRLVAIHLQHGGGEEAGGGGVLQFHADLQLVLRLGSFSSEQQACV